MLMGVYETGETVSIHELLLPLEQKEGGKLVECYFSFCYSPVYSDFKVGGVLSTVF